MRSSLLPCKRLRVPFFGGDGLLIGDIMSGGNDILVGRGGRGVF